MSACRTFCSTDRDAVAVDGLDHLEDLPHDPGREAERGLVQHEQSGPRHERAADRAHLLLAAREQPRELGLPLGEHGKERVDVREAHLPRANRSRRCRSSFSSSMWCPPFSDMSPSSPSPRRRTHTGLLGALCRIALSLLPGLRLGMGDARTRTLESPAFRRSG